MYFRRSDGALFVKRGSVYLSRRYPLRSTENRLLEISSIENTEDYTLTVKVGNVEKTVSGTILDNDVPEAVITPKDPKDPDPEVPTDPKDPTKPEDPKDPTIGTKGAVAVEGEDLVFTVKVTQSVNPET